MSLLKNVGSIAGGLLGGVAGAYLGNPALGASIGASLGGGLGPSESRLAERSRWQQQREAIGFWNMENQYNSPLEQMKRFAEAGLNPYMIYQNGGVDNNARSIQTVNQPYMRSSSGNSHLSNSVQRFFLNKSMENAQDQSRANMLNETYLDLRNKYMQAKIGNELTKQNKYGTKTERSIKDLIDEARYQKLLNELNNPYASGSLVNVRTYQNVLNPNFREVYGKDWALKEGLYRRKVRWPTAEEASRWRFWNKFNNAIDTIRSW